MSSNGRGGIDQALRALSRYQYDVFISYAKPDEPIAGNLRSWLESRGLKPFFAPFSLDDPELKSANQWVGILRQALGQSCHYSGLVSAHFVATAWCELELRGFQNLIKANPARGMLLFPLDAGGDQLGDDLKDRFFSGDFQAFQSCLADLARNGSLHVDDLISPFPPRTFRPLPLRDKYGLAAPWGKDSQTPGGHPAGAPYSAYEECVREIMVQIRRGGAPEKVMEGIRGWPWEDVNLREARGDALELLAQGVSPFAG